MKRATIDKNGKPTGFYSERVHGAKIPEEAVQITDEQWKTLISSPGEYAIVVDDEGVTSLEPVDSTPPEPTLDEVKEAKLAEINAACSSELESLQAGYPRGEIVSWDKQEQEARAYLADNSASVPFISGLASERGQTVGEIANRIIAKADTFTAQASTLIGKRHRLEDEIAECSTVADVRAIVW